MTESYGQILRSSSIVGFAQAINYLIALVRMKVVAVLIGPAGVGLMGVYVSATSLIGVVAGLGIQSSAVRAISLADAKKDSLVIARTVRILRRLVWATGALAWLVSVLVAWPLSRWIFGSASHAWALSILGLGLLLTAISNGQLALLQGLRRIGDIARAQVAAALTNAAVSVAIFAALGERGVVPALLASSSISLAASWWFARRVRLVHIDLAWNEMIADAKPLVRLGIAMMWSGALSTLLDIYIRAFISRELGLHAAGIYQAAWALSGLFAGFLLTAMGADFYPRLTSVIHEKARACRLVNEQTEIGVLLAVPGLLVTLAVSDLIIRLLYTKDFLPAAEVLTWFVLGVFGRVVSWPMGYIIIAKGSISWLIVSEMTLLLVQAAFASWLIPRAGVVGAAYAFAAAYALHLTLMRFVGGRLIGFTWSRVTRSLLLRSLGLIGLAMCSKFLLAEAAQAMVGCLLAAVGSLLCLRGLAERLDADHRLQRLFRFLPFVGRRQ